MAVGNVFTRFGCHLTGCCAGRVTAGRFGAGLPNRAGVRARRVPTQLLESALAGVAVVAALVLRSTLDFDGAVHGDHDGEHGAGRVILEGLREGQPGRTASSLNVWVAIGLVVLGASVVIAGAAA